MSVRAKRGRTIRACVILTLGLLIMLLAGPWSHSFISPGKLIAAHEGISGPDGSDANCAACHTAARVGLAGWIKAAFVGTGVRESANCLGCHFDEGDTARAHALFVHNVDPESLSEKTAGLTENTTEPDEAGSGAGGLRFALASLVGGPPVSSAGEMECASCHQEHRGPDHDLTRMDDTSCQVCHETKFESFADGHPEFMPIARTRGGISFDHESHRKTHFGEAGFDCARCHLPDPEGRTMVLEPFSRSCAGCHSQGKADHHGDRIKSGDRALFQLPYMEFDEAEPYWPEDAARGEELTGLMLLLLSGDDDAIEPLRALEDEDVDWIPEDWWPDTDDPKVRLAAAIKRLVHDLVSNDEDVLSERVARAFGGEPTYPTVAALGEQLSSASFAFLAFQSRWLPGLADDLAGKDVEEAEDEGPKWSRPAGASGWYVDSRRVSVGYRPTAHSDAFLKGWIDALGAHADGESDVKETTEERAYRRQLRTQLFRGATKRGFLYSTCLRCHAVDPEGAAYRVNWTAAGHETGARGYSKFDHRPHLDIATGDQPCQQCHQLADASEGEGVQVAHGILPHRKEQCAGCHAPGHVSDDCLICHEFHFQRP